MYKNVSAYTIIFNLRKKGKLSIADLLEIVFGEREFQKESRDVAFSKILIDLLNERFIEVVEEATSDGNEFSKFFKSQKFKRGQKIGLEDGYDLLFKVNPESIFLKITSYFFQVQEIIGFSISDNFKHRYGYRESMWGDVNHKLVSQVFVIMPFLDDLRPVYDDHISKVCKKIGYSCLRADDIFAAHNIMNGIWSYIYNADVIICDCTGRNPNVFYELGIAHSIGKNVICITQREDDIPFDIRAIRYLKYEYTPRAMIQFEEKLEKYLAIAMSKVISERENFY